MTDVKEVDWDLVRYLIPENIKVSQLYYYLVQRRKYDTDIEYKQKQLERAKLFNKKAFIDEYRKRQKIAEEKDKIIRTKFINNRIIVYFD